jgi:hypothetical protein
MALNPTPPISPTRPGVDPVADHIDTVRRDQMSPNRRARRKTTSYWVVAALVALALLALLFFMRREPATLPPAQTTGETAPTTEPVPVTPSQPELDTPTPTPVTPPLPEPTAPTQP